MRRALAVLLTAIAILGSVWLVLRRGDIPFSDLEAAYATPDSQYLALGDGSFIHYTDTGRADAPVVVLIHGFADSLHSWSAVRPTLEQNWRVITLDLDGHGLSRSPAGSAMDFVHLQKGVRTMLDRMDIDRATLVGTSLGARVALDFAARTPDRVDALVLIGPVATPRETFSPLSRNILLNPIGRSLTSDLSPDLLLGSRLERLATDAKSLPDGFAERQADLARAPGRREATLALLLEPDGPSLTDLASRLNMPVLLVRGANDPLVSEATLNTMADRLHDGRIVEIQNAGHLPHAEAAKPLCDAIVDFLSEPDRAGVPPAPTTHGQMVPR